MISLKQLRLRNFCQFEDMAVEFSPGLTAIIGPNGSGKSNLLGSLAGALTGSFDVAPGKKSSNIRLNAPDNAPSSVELTLKLAGGTGTIVRSFAPPGQCLEHDGRELTKVADLDKEIAGWLGMPPALFVEFAFAFQWQIFKILAAQPGERASMLHKLFRLEVAERIHTEAGKYLASLKLPAVENTDTLKNWLAQADPASLEAKLAAIPEVGKDEVSNLHLRMRRREKAIELDGQIKGEEARLYNYSRKQEDLIASRGPAQQALEAMGSRTDLENALQHARSEWQRCRTTDADRKRLKTLDEMRAGFVAEVAKYPEPPVPTDTWTAEDDNRTVEVKAKISRVEAFIATAQAGNAECLACGQPLTGVVANLDNYRAEAKELRTEMTQLKQRWSAITEANSRRATYSKWKAEQDAKLARMDGERDSLQQSLASAGSETSEYWEKQVFDVMERVKTLTGLQDVITNVDRELKILQSQISDTQVRVNRLIEERKSLPVETATQKELEEQIHEVSTRAIQRATLTEQLKALKDRIDWTRNAIAAAEKNAVDFAILSEWKAKVYRVRDVMGKDGLPRLVSKANLENLMLAVNDQLRDFEADFSVFEDEQLNFHVRKANGCEHPAGRLSGGEKVLFALAWRVAAHSQFAVDVPLLCLDEPTAGLDAERIVSVRRALGRLRDLAGERGLQCIVVTHDKELAPLFDKVIELRSLS